MYFLSLQNHSSELVMSLVYNAAKIKQKEFDISQSLNGRVLALIFEKPSTRTRVSFEVGIKQMGGSTIVLNRNDIQLSRGESISDTAKVLARYCDGFIMRTFSHDTLSTFADETKKPVINALTDQFHPCQALADFLTIFENGIAFNELKLCYLGDGSSNMCNSLILAATMLGAEIRVATTKAYAPNEKIQKMANEAKGRLIVTDNLEEALADANVLYTDVWVSMGQEEEKEARMNALRPFQLNKNAISMAGKEAIVLHCLPAYKGIEISEEAFESANSRIFDQAENRLHVQQSLMHYLFSQSN